MLHHGAAPCHWPLGHWPPATPPTVVGTFQISDAYSEIVRSEENHATRAVFSTLARHQA